jgi:hypothetical protein
MGKAFISITPMQVEVVDVEKALQFSERANALKALNIRLL